MLLWQLLEKINPRWKVQKYKHTSPPPQATGSNHLTPHLPGALTFNTRFLPSNYALSGSPRRFPAERFAPGHVVSGKYDCAGKQFSICSAAIGPICIAFAIRYADKRRIIIGRRHLGLATMCVSGALSVTDVDSFIPRGFPIGDSKKTTRVWENAWLPSDRLRRADFPVNLLDATSVRKSTVEPWPDL